MALNPVTIANLVFADHLALFPDSVDYPRSNPETGVPLHLPAEAFIQGLVNGVVAAAGSMQLLDKGEGEDNTPGTANPVNFEITGIQQAEETFIAVAEWNGELASDVVAIFIGSVLTHIQDQGLLQMSDNDGMGDGTSIVSPASNPNQEDLLFEELRTQLVLSFQATGKFGKDDIPSNPVNKILLDQIDNYARAYAVGFASIVATVEYTAPGGGNSVNNILNTGSII
jgi:hypothetical protein